MEIECMGDGHLYSHASNSEPKLQEGKGKII